MKPISERAWELYKADPERESFAAVVHMRATLAAIDEWQKSVEERLASLCEARAKECPHFEFMGGCWKETGERICTTACNCDCHRCVGARLAEIEQHPALSIPELRKGRGFSFTPTQLGGHVVKLDVQTGAGSVTSPDGVTSKYTPEPENVPE